MTWIALSTPTPQQFGAGAWLVPLLLIMVLVGALRDRG